MIADHLDLAEAQAAVAAPKSCIDPPILLGGKTDGRQRARDLLRYLEVDNREHSYPEMSSAGF